MMLGRTGHPRFHVILGEIPQQSMQRACLSTWLRGETKARPNWDKSVPVLSMYCCCSEGECPFLTQKVPFGHGMRD